MNHLVDRAVQQHPAIPVADPLSFVDYQHRNPNQPLVTVQQTEQAFLGEDKDDAGICLLGIDRRWHTSHRYLRDSRFGQLLPKRDDDLADQRARRHDVNHTNVLRGS